MQFFVILFEGPRCPQNHQFDHYLILNTQYLRNSTIVYLLKMEYGWNIWSFGLIFFSKIPSCAKPFFYFIEVKNFVQSYKFINKNDLICAWKDFTKKNFVVYDNRNFKPKISPIFHFKQVNDGWVSHKLCVNRAKQSPT